MRNLNKFGFGLVVLLFAAGLTSCRKEGALSAAATAGLTKSDLTVAAFNWSR